MNLRPLRPDHFKKSLSRRNYRQRSESFVGWVNKLGIERTFVGRVAHFFDQKFHLRQLSLVFLLCLGVSFLISWDLQENYAGYKEGDVAASNLKSLMNLDVIDQVQTPARKA